MTNYYGVIGNRDHIKIKGEKRPFWEFLDEQPDGYLTSLVYMRKDLPNTHIIFDCGAWSYRNEDKPNITPKIALEKYIELAKPGDFLIAPDHMLIDGFDYKERQKFNIESAKRFIKICPKDYIPMATTHGMNIKERIYNANRVIDFGYTHIAIGGIAARAAQKRLCISMVKKIRETFPDVWLHVLGLSSPDYTKAWNDIGVQSFDGSSHFKQAFTGGTFFTIKDGKLKKWQAARMGENITAPKCNCTACDLLQKEGVDTRSYGSNENNMGRAAHNMNMLMKAQKIAINGTTILISCVSKKNKSPQYAKDFYQSDWFKKARIYAEQNGDRWFILSAAYGLVHPDELLHYYDCTLNTMDKASRARWSSGVHNQIIKNIPIGRLIFLAGKKYREGLEITLKGAGYTINSPMKGMGIGQQLSWLNSQNQKQGELWK